MSSRSNATWMRAVGSGSILLALVVGVPVALVVLVGWPLPTTVPDPGEVRTMLVQGNIPARFVTGSLAVVAWVVWAQVAWAALWEAVVNGRRLARGIRTVPAPLVAGPVNALVVRLISGALAVSILASGPSSPAAALPDLPTSEQAESPTPSVPAPEVGTAPPAATGARWVVAADDSLWSIAEVALGDGARSGELLTLNPELPSARSLRAGMVLELPLGAAVPTDRAPETAARNRPAMPTTAGTAAVAPSAVHVAPGDNLWRLSEGRADAAGLDVDAGDIAAQVAEVVAANPAEIHDPDLIFPGQVLHFPALGEDGTPSSAPPGEPAGSDSAPSGPDPDPDSRTGVESGYGSEAGYGSEPGVGPEVGAEGPTEPTAAPAGPVADGADGPAGSTGLDLRSVLPLAETGLVALGAGSTLLAAGALDSVRRRRRYRQAHRARGRVPAPVPAHLAAVEETVLRLGDETTAGWVRTALASLSARPVWQGEEVAQPIVVRLDDDQLSVSLSAADPMGAPLPWRTGDGGRTWVLDRATPREELDSFHARPVAPTVVTMGAGLLVNLEAVGVLTVVGPGDQTRAVARSLVHELATSPSAGLLDIRTTVALDGVEAHPLVRRATAGALAVELVPWLDETARALEDHGATNSFARRVETNGDAMAPVVVVTDEMSRDELAPVLIRAARRRLPVAVVVLACSSSDAIGDGTDEGGEAGGTGGPVELHLNGDRAVLRPWGLEAPAQLLSAEAATKLGALLAEATDGGDEALPDVILPTTPVAELHPDPDPDPGAGAHPDPDPDPGADLVVQVLGPVSVLGLEDGVELTSQQLSLLTFLACNGPTSRGVVIDALWDGQAISRSRFPNLLTELRSRIGRHHLPELRDGRYRLAGVGTDLARFDRCVAEADRTDPATALASLRSALSLVRGKPLTAPGARFWTWVDDHTHYAARLEAQVAEVAARAAELASGAGDRDGARWACEQGLAASPDDVTLVTLLTGIYVEDGRMGAARRLVDRWEDRISRMECGEPSDEPRRRLAG